MTPNAQLEPINMDNDLVKRMTARRIDISTNGRKLRGVSPNVNPEVPPPWYDKSTFEHAQQLFQTYKVIIRLSQLYGLNLVLYQTSGLVPLLVTGNSRNISKLFTRYLSTTIHVSNWFEHDPFDPESKSFRSLKMVRGMHKRVGEKMNKADNRNEGVDNLWIPQFGMCHAQFSFVGFMAIFPKELGFHNFTERDLSSLFHFWRVIGHCLGIDDRYNLCDGTYEETIELCRQIYFEEWLPIIREGSEKVGEAMSKGICTAMSRLNPNLNYNALMRYASSFMKLDPERFPLKTTQEKCLYMTYTFGFKYGLRSKTVNWMMSRIGDLRLSYAIKKRKFHEQDLLEKYPDISYENDRCPFEVKFNYVTATNTYFGEKPKNIDSQSII